MGESSLVLESKISIFRREPSFALRGFLEEAATRLSSDENARGFLSNDSMLDVVRNAFNAYKRIPAGR